MINGFLRWSNLGEALVREAIIVSLKDNVAYTIHYLGHHTSISTMLNELNTVYGVVASYDMLIWKLYQVTQERGESTSDYLIHVEGVLNVIKMKSPT